MIIPHYYENPHTLHVGTIARAEGVHEKVVRVAIERGLRRLEKILKNSL